MAIYTKHSTFVWASRIVMAALASMLALPQAVCSAEEQTSPAPALRVGDGGVILKDGKPYRGIGINYFSAFRRALDEPEDTSYREGFDVLARHGIPFIRFMAGAFWASEWKLYLEDKDEYFARMDRFVQAAEEKGIGLIPSLFWWTACVPDIVDEPRGQWGNPDSKTIAFMRQYTKEVVTRYLDSPAIWVWELGNEYSLEADLPNAADHRPWVHPELGTRAERGPEDDMTHEMIVTASREFAKTVRMYHRLRLITTGHSIPRQAIYHMRTEGSWTRDTREQFTENLLEVTPDPANVVSIHMYPECRQKRFGEDAVSFEEIVSLCLDTSSKAGKALFVGEFGASDTEEDGGPEQARKDCLAILAAIETTGVPLAALWVFDLPHQDSFINITPTNHRSYLLEELARANQRLCRETAQAGPSGAVTDDPNDLSITLVHGEGGPDGRGPVYVNDVAITSMSELSRVLAEAHRERPDVMVLVRADARIESARVIKVLDIVKSVGIERCGIAAQPPDVESGE